MSNFHDSEELYPIEEDCPLIEYIKNPCTYMYKLFNNKYCENDYTGNRLSFDISNGTDLIISDEPDDGYIHYLFYYGESISEEEFINECKKLDKEFKEENKIFNMDNYEKSEYIINTYSKQLTKDSNTEDGRLYKKYITYYYNIMDDDEDDDVLYININNKKLIRFLKKLKNELLNYNIKLHTFISTDLNKIKYLGLSGLEYYGVYIDYKIFVEIFRRYQKIIIDKYDELKNIPIKFNKEKFIMNEEIEECPVCKEDAIFYTHYSCCDKHIICLDCAQTQQKQCYYRCNGIIKSDVIFKTYPHFLN